MADSKASTSDLDEVDAGWDDDEEDEAEEEDVDAGWDDLEPGATATRGDGPSPKRLTTEEREARAARAASKKERQRAKAAEKARRRKARQSAADLKQKKARARGQRLPDAAEERGVVDEERPPRPGASPPSPARATSRSRPAIPWRQWGLLLLVLVLGTGGIAVFLWKR